MRCAIRTARTIKSAPRAVRRSFRPKAPSALSLSHNMYYVNYAILLALLAIAVVALPLQALSEPAQNDGTAQAAESVNTDIWEAQAQLDDDSVKELLLAVARGDSLTEELAQVADAFLSLSHRELMTRALEHVRLGQYGRAELELTVVVAGADTSPARSYEQLSLIGYAQLMSDRGPHAAASLIRAGDIYTKLPRPVNPSLGEAISRALGFAYVDVARGADDEDDRETAGRQAALWWARAGADQLLKTLGGLGPDELMIAAWAYNQIGRLDRATVFVARARLQYRARIARDPGNGDAHLGLARSYDASVTAMPSSANPDSAAFHYGHAGDVR